MSINSQPEGVGEPSITRQQIPDTPETPAPPPQSAPPPQAQPATAPQAQPGPPPTQPVTAPQGQPATAPQSQPGPPPAQPVTAPQSQPGPPPTQPATAPQGQPAPPRQPATLRHSRAGGLWTLAALGAAILVLLLVFILQNGQHVEIHIYGAHWNAPLGVALLMAAALGVLLVVVPGAARIIQLKRAARNLHRDRVVLAERLDRATTTTPDPE